MLLTKEQKLTLQDKQNLLNAGKAKNSSEQQAVTNYIDAVNNAVSIRRQAYDSARQTFRSSVEAAINARQSIVTQHLIRFKTL